MEYALILFTLGLAIEEPKEVKIESYSYDFEIAEMPAEINLMINWEEEHYYNLEETNYYEKDKRRKSTDITHKSVRSLLYRNVLSELLSKPVHETDSDEEEEQSPSVKGGIDGNQSKVFNEIDKVDEEGDDIDADS